MKHYVLFFVYSIGALSMAMRKKEEIVIPGASYHVYQGSNRFEYAEERKIFLHDNVNFYTARGELLKTLHFKKSSFRDLEEMYQYLDPTAPKPRPVSMEIKYWPGYCVGANGSVDVYRGKASNYLYFYDGNENLIQRFPYRQQTEEVSVKQSDGSVEVFNIKDSEALKDFPLDLSDLAGLKK